PASSVQLDPSNGGRCNFPYYLNQGGPWLFQYRQARDPATGERLPSDEIRYGEASIPSRHNLRHHRIRLVRGADEFREALLEERRESLDCVEKSAGSSGRVQTFVAAHYHTEKSTAVVQIVCRQLYECDLSDKWLSDTVQEDSPTGQSSIGSMRAMTAKLRLVNTRSNGDIWQKNTFALVQSQCVYGTGMAWLFLQHSTREQLTGVRPILSIAKGNSHPGFD
uniref:Glyco_hydro_38C domain-containing protein n=1 Tax=Macrostomum lignano TaxID=282301 RepID=A0A1I8JRJ8_9PLAT